MIIKALFYINFGVVLNGTDSVIVSSFLGTGMVGILANYNMIVKNIYNLVLQVLLLLLPVSEILQQQRMERSSLKSLTPCS